MGKSANIEFDDKSLEILKGVDKVHRDSLVNVGLALASKTGYYKTLAGLTSEDLTEVASLDNLEEMLNEDSKSKDVKKDKTKDDTKWDGDDFF